MNSKVTVARSPVRNRPWGWSMPTIRTVCRTACDLYDDEYVTFPKVLADILRSEASPDNLSVKLYYGWM